jgi:hypothetical protein
MSLVLLPIATNVSRAWADINPPSCTDPSVGGSALERRLDLNTNTFIPIVGDKIEGETIFYTGRLTASSSEADCGYEDGKMCID